MAFTLPDLPYEKNALEPYISAQTLEIHHGKHHAAYVNNLNGLVKGTEFENSSLEEVIAGSQGGIFNNAAQVWNHTFYWNCMIPDANITPTCSKLNTAIESAFGSVDAFKTAFTEAAKTQFGSGWAWLVYDCNKNTLAITKTGNAETPLTQSGIVPLLTIDVWEHAYYLDYQNRRPDYIQTFLDKLVNWTHVATLYKNTIKQQAA